METTEDTAQEVLDRERRLQRLVEKFGTFEDFMTQEELRQLREEPPIETLTQGQEWPIDFWQVFEGVPADFERPAPAPQNREFDF